MRAVFWDISIRLKRFDFLCMEKLLKAILGSNSRLDEKKLKVLNEAFDLFMNFDEAETEPPSSAICLMMTSCGHKLPQVLASSINSFGESHFCFSQVCRFIDFYEADIHWPGLIPGFGHPKYKDNDPRVSYLVKFCNQIKYIPTNLPNMIRISEAKKLVLNFAGFITCVLRDCGFDEHNIDLVPMIWRMVGLTNMHRTAKLGGLKLNSSYGVLEEYKKINGEN